MREQCGPAPARGPGNSGSWVGSEAFTGSPGRCRREWRRGEHGDESDGCILQARARWWEDGQRSSGDTGLGDAEM